MTDYTPAFDMLTNGTFFGSINLLYTTAMGAWWILILYVVTLMSIYLISKSEAAVAAFGFLGSAALLYKLNLIPVGMQVSLYIILSLSLAMLLYKVFGRGE